VHNREQRKARVLDPGNQSSISLSIFVATEPIYVAKNSSGRGKLLLSKYFLLYVCVFERERVEKFSAHDPGNRIADRNARELDIAIAVALAERRRS
jgi:hypothetical protein